MTESRPATGRLPRALLGMAVALGAAQSALVQAAWPERPVRFIVPYAAGGPVEGTIRIFSNTLPKFLGQPIIIEAKAGGNTVIGADFVAKSAPDGYTMLVMRPAHAAQCMPSSMTCDDQAAPRPEAGPGSSRGWLNCCQACGSSRSVVLMGQAYPPRLTGNLTWIKDAEYPRD